MQVESVYEVTELSKGGLVTDIQINGTGQEAIKELRKHYHFFTKFVLRGFIINSIFVPLKLRYR